MTDRVTATERMQRILAVLPWILANQGSTVDEIADRFGLERTALVKDLEFVFYNVGLHPFTPDVLAEVTIDDDRVRVHLGDYFRKPLRLSHSEALTLLAAGRALGARAGTDPDGTLARAVDKLAAVLGDGAADAIDVALGEADPEVLATVRQGVDTSRSLRIDYYSYGRDEHTERVVDPYRLVSREGHWYLQAYCHRAEGERLFRVDRIRRAETTDRSFEVPPGALDAGFDLEDSSRTVVVVAPAEADWVARTYPSEEVDALDDGRLRIVLPVSASAWLERLLLRLGPGAEVRDAATGESLDPVGREAARRVLDRYER